MPEHAHLTHESRLLGVLQSGFPLSREPYEDIGLKLDMTGDDVIRGIIELKKTGIVRQISPVLDARKLGFRSTLAAMKVEGPNIERAERFLSAHSGISHGYERRHEFNIWVTLSVPAGTNLQAVVRDISARSGARAIISLPATRIFKLRTNFSYVDDTSDEADFLNGSGLPVKANLSQTDREIINGLQHDLPLSADPFAALARDISMDVEKMLMHSRVLLRRGIIRRYGAAINHHLAGYKANAMTCWNVPANKVDELGRKLASNRQVSHCYERATVDSWHYNLFAMVHSRDKTACMKTIDRMSVVTGLTDYQVLFSLKEFKKTRIQYRV